MYAMCYMLETWVQIAIIFLWYLTLEKAQIRTEHSLSLVTCIQMYSDDIAPLRVNLEQK